MLICLTFSLPEKSKIFKKTDCTPSQVYIRLRSPIAVSSFSHFFSALCPEPLPFLECEIMMLSFTFIFHQLIKSAASCIHDVQRGIHLVWKMLLHHDTLDSSRDLSWLDLCAGLPFDHYVRRLLGYTQESYMYSCGASRSGLCLLLRMYLPRDKVHLDQWTDMVDPMKE